MTYFVVTLLSAANVLAANVGATNANKSNSVGTSDTTKPTFGLSVSASSNTMIAGKYFLDDEFAILGGLGLSNRESATDLYFMGGLRKYMRKNSSEFVPFVGGKGWYSSIKSANVSTFGLAAEAGAEYFLNKHFSFEGTVAAGYASTSPNSGASTSTFGTTVYGLAFNFYF